jgi:GT2 family glycosyltransferase
VISGNGLKEKAMDSAPSVSAIIVNWNGARHLEICLPSLLTQSYRPLEIVVVDNASTDGSLAVVQSHGVQWLSLNRNMGLATALNRGAHAAAGDLVLFLNNDMRFHEAFINSMVTSMMRAPDIFSVDALQYDWTGSKPVHLATRLSKRHRADQLCYPIVPALYVFQESRNSPTDALMSSAANMLVRKSMFQALGGFDERLPLGYEDVELCWRAWVRGWKTVFEPAAVCWHRVGASTGSTEAATRMSSRGILSGRLLMATKLFPLKFAVTTWLATVAGLAVDLGYWRWERAVDRIEVLTEFARHLLPLMRERHSIYSLGRVSPSEQLKRLLEMTAI